MSYFFTSDEQKEVEHLEWYIKKEKESLSGPYSKVFSVASKKFKRDEIKKLQKRIIELKFKIKGQK